MNEKIKSLNLLIDTDNATSVTSSIFKEIFVYECGGQGKERSFFTVTASETKEELKKNIEYNYQVPNIEEKLSNEDRVLLSSALDPKLVTSVSEEETKMKKKIMIRFPVIRLQVRRE